MPLYNIHKNPEINQAFVCYSKSSITGCLFSIL